MTNITEFLAEQKRLAEAASPGPWQAVSARYGYDVSETWAVEPVGPSVHNVCHVTIGEADAAFIAAARTTAPRMIAALEAVLAVLSSEEEWLDHLMETGEGGMRRVVGIGRVRAAIEAALIGGEGE